MARRHLVIAFVVVALFLVGFILNSWYSAYTSLFHQTPPSKIMVQGEDVSIEGYLQTDPPSGSLMQRFTTTTTALP